MNGYGQMKKMISILVVTLLLSPTTVRAQVALATEEPQMITEYVPEGYYVPWASMEISLPDFDLMCHTVYREAGNQSLEAQILVARVILFRVMSKHFPDSVHEVIYQRNPTQFNVVDLPGFPEAYVYPDKTEEAVYLAIATYPFEPRNVLYFRSGHYFEDLAKYENIDDMYFSYGKE